MAALRSYVNGDWHAPSDDGIPMRDAVTGEEVARVSSAGIDMAGVLAYGRTRGLFDAPAGAAMAQRTGLSRPQRLSWMITAKW